MKRLPKTTTALERRLGQIQRELEHRRNAQGPVWLEKQRHVSEVLMEDPATRDLVQRTRHAEAMSLAIEMTAERFGKKVDPMTLIDIRRRADIQADSCTPLDLMGLTNQERHDSNTKEAPP